jgi:hypothetical protein
VWPQDSSTGASTDGLGPQLTGNTEDPLMNQIISSVPVTIPGDNAPHTITFEWQPSQSTTGFNIYGRSIYAFNPASV